MSSPVSLPRRDDDGSTDRDDVTTTITPYADGPLIVRGSFRIVDPDGVPLDPGRDSVALCRCGRSRAKPFCDGTHKLARFVSGPSAHRAEPPRIRPAPEAPED